MMIASRSMTVGIAVALAATIGAATVAGDTVARRGGLSTLVGEVQLVNDGGVEIRTESGIRQIVPWDQVREITSESHETDIRNRRETAELVWRARSRVERHDTALAEPLFERLFEHYRGATNQTALVVAEGLLRCRLARGAHALAVIPALETVRLRRAGLTHENTGTYGQLPPIIDERFEICTTLAPTWIATPALGKLHQDLLEYDAKDDAVVAAMAALYAHSVARSLSIESPPPAELPDHFGVELLSNLVQSADPSDAERERARNWLARAEETLPPFAQAWSRFHSGASLLIEEGLVRQQRGLVNLLHVPALHGDSQKYLAGIALSLVASALESQGETDAAHILRLELDSDYPNHPVRAHAPQSQPTNPVGAVSDPQSDEHSARIALKEIS